MDSGTSAFYYYFLDRDLGLIHVKLQSWFPCQIQIYVNGHEWLARQLDRHGVKYVKLDNAFVRLSDVERAQELADSFERVDWIHVLGRYALRVNPLLRQKSVLHPGAVLLGNRPVREDTTEDLRSIESPAPGIATRLREAGWGC